MERLKNKVAVVTGAGSGLGKEISILFSAEGAKIIAADVNETNLAALKETIQNKGGQIVTVKGDISSQPDVDHIFDTALHEFGTVDILVNNAGVLDNFAPVGEENDEIWNRVININLNGTMRMSRRAVNIMLKNGKGNIVNIASIGGLQGFRAGAAYTASKHAVIGLTKSTAFAYAPQKIRCNAIAPGAMNTAIASSVNPQIQSQLGLGRMYPAMEGTMKGIAITEPVWVAYVALFLASDEAEYVNGAVVVADGGWTSF